MKRTLTVLFALGLALGSPAIFAAASVDECKETVATFKKLGNVSEMLAQSYGYAVLPTVAKAGIGIGGAGGSGCVIADGKHTGNVTMAQVTIGMQLGGQAYSQLVLFQNEDTYKEFTSGNFEFGADASAVALTYGASATASTQGPSATARDTVVACISKASATSFIVSGLRKRGPLLKKSFCRKINW